MNKYDLVIFDLDGTLLDTSPGIFGSVRYAEKVMGLKPIADCELRKFVGPPPKEMYKKIYGLSDEDAMTATKAHRKYGVEKAVFQAEIYSGMKETLEKLKTCGFKLAVATLKKQNIAEIVLKNFGMYDFFDVVVGIDELESLTKAQTIEICLSKTNSEFAVMVGDSEYDFKGAVEAKVDFIGVLYGFGFENGIDYPFDIITKPDELLDLVIE